MDEVHKFCETLLDTGDPQQKDFDRSPITFSRQVSTLVENPELMEIAKDAFPSDAIERAQELLRGVGSNSAHSHPQGTLFIRQSVAKFIEERDGYPSDPNHIFMTAGEPPGVYLMVQMLVGSITRDSPHSSGVLIPAPQCPLYASTLPQFPGVLLPYRLDEKRDRVAFLTGINATLAHAREKGIVPRGLIINNLGGIAGTLLDRSTQEGLVELCDEQKLVLIVDEVYQFGAHRPEKVHLSSFKKIVREMNSPVALVSCNSLCEGAATEGRRGGGYFELTNFSDEFVGVVRKMVSTGFCPPISYQINVDSMVRPPKLGSPSYDLWKKETDAMSATFSLGDDPQARFGLDERMETFQTMDPIRPTAGEAQKNLDDSEVNPLGRCSQTHPDNLAGRQQHRDPLDSQENAPRSGRGSQASRFSQPKDASVTVSHLSSVGDPPHHDYIQGVGSTDIPGNTATTNMQRSLLQQYSSGFFWQRG